MYENEIAMTGLGTLVIGPVVVNQWWAAVVLVALGASLLVVARFVHRHRQAP